jgi:hypothetical protein
MSRFAFLFLLASASTQPSFAYVPLDEMTCTGPFVPLFFIDLTPRPDLNGFMSAQGSHPDTFYKFELASDVFVSPPTFNGGHSQEYVFLTVDETMGLGVSRFNFRKDAAGKSLLTLMAQHSVALDEDAKTLQYRDLSNTASEPDWICRY